MEDATLLKVIGMAAVTATAAFCLYMNRSDGVLTIVVGFVSGLFIGQEIEKKKKVVDNETGNTS